MKYAHSPRRSRWFEPGTAWLVLAIALVGGLLIAARASGQEVPPESRDWLWVHTEGEDPRVTGTIVEAYIQSTHIPGDVAGVLVFADGRRLAISGHLESVPTTAPVSAPMPIATGLGIEGNLTAPGALRASYVYQGAAGSEGATVIRWLLAGVEVATGPIWTWGPSDGGRTLTLEVTPVSDAGVAGQTIQTQIDLPEQGSPPTAEWGPPSWWPERLDRPHPRGPGPVNGPQPAAGAYLDVAPASQLAAHVTAAGLWDPTKPFAQDARNWSHDVVVAWLKDRDPGTLAKAQTWLARLGSGRWWLLGAAVLADHMWDDLSPDLRAAVSERVLAELDAHRTGERPGFGWSDAWEGAPQSCFPDAYAWSLVVFYDHADPRWRTLAEWWGGKWYGQWAPFYWHVLVGEDGAASWGQDTYWRSAMGDYLYHAYLALTVATGEDHFLTRELGGWYGRLLPMQRHRMLPSGQDVSIGNQANSWSNGYVDSPALGWPHHAALAFQVRDPAATWVSWSQATSSTRSPTTVYSPPWSAFLDLAAPRAPPAEWERAVRFQAYAVARQEWDQGSGLAAWTRGDVLCHHTVPQPGFVGFWGRATEPDAVGGWLVAPGRHYGFGSNSVAYDGSYGDTGVLFFSPDDPSPTAARPLFRSPAGTTLTNYCNGENDGGPRPVQNPWADRASQRSYDDPGLYASLLLRHMEFASSNPLGWFTGEVSGVRVTAEAIDWSPSFTDPGPGPVPYPFPPVSRRPTRGLWRRAVAFLDRPGDHPAVVVLDQVRAIPGVSTAVQWRTMRALEPAGPGRWHFRRDADLQSLDGGWPHVMGPATARLAGNRLRVRGELWMETSAAGGEVFGGPEAPFTRATPTGTVSLTGVRQYPYASVQALWTDAGPDEHAPWLWLARLPDGVVDIWTVFTSGPDAATVVEVPGGVKVFGVTVTMAADGSLGID